MTPKVPARHPLSNYASWMKPSHLAAALVLLLGACGPAQPGPVEQPRLQIKDLPIADAPYELANERDLEDRRDHYESFDGNDPERATHRQQLAAEYGRRMKDALASEAEGRDAHEELLQLMSLWSGPELARNDADLRATLAPYLPAVRDMRKRYSRAGRDIEATSALYFLTLADPSKRDRYLAEIDEIFVYTNALARTQFGEGAEGSRPITILETIVEHVSVPDAVDRLVELYIHRQKVITEGFDKPDRRLDLIRAHGAGVLQTAWHIVRVLGRAQRLSEATRHMTRFKGIGTDDEMAEALERVAQGTASPVDWVRVLQNFVESGSKEDEEDKASRLRAALALCRQALAAQPERAGFAACAAEAARSLDMLHVAVRHYEQALALDPTDRDNADTLADLYRVRVSTLAFYERPLAAQKRLVELEAFHEMAARTWPEKPLESDLAQAYASMGSGLVSLGELAEGTRFLEKSLSLRTTAAALEQLGTVAFKRDRFSDAVERYGRALEVKPAGPLGEYNRARILRLTGDALAKNGDPDQAADRWKQSIMAWIALDARLDLPPNYKGELLVESGKAQWALGDAETAFAAFEAAVDADTDGADTHSAVISFLIVRGHYTRALDAYHRALGSHEISDYSKVYMSLWVLVEARRNGIAPDPLVLEYLGGRDGRLWHDQLARLATGRAEVTALEQKATTRGRRAELLYYSGVLDDSLDADAMRAVLQTVVETDMVSFYEYEMAKYWLAEGFASRPAESSAANQPAP